MADELQQALDCTVTLTPGKTGDFEVVRDGTIIYSKQQTGCFPQTEDILRILTA
ncbi:MAG: hypothetical protein CSA21_02120 [Deltaproteobacteria bacterium]|nr:MAG: hypothetical protein CSA21_02120 [Deltaproteobacteria bacterium]